MKLGNCCDCGVVVFAGPLYQGMGNYKYICLDCASHRRRLDFQGGNVWFGTGQSDLEYGSEWFGFSGCNCCDLCNDSVPTIATFPDASVSNFCFDCLRLLMDWYAENVPNKPQMIDSEVPARDDILSDWVF